MTTEKIKLNRQTEKHQIINFFNDSEAETKYNDIIKPVIDEFLCNSDKSMFLYKSNNVNYFELFYTNNKKLLNFSFRTLTVHKVYWLGGCPISPDGVGFEIKKDHKDKILIKKRRIQGKNYELIEVAKKIRYKDKSRV